jgi:hypothetical protein
VSLPLEDWRQLRQLGANPVVGFARVETTAPHALPSLVSSTRAVEVAFDFAAFESRDGQRPAHYVSVHYPALSSWPSETALHDEVRAVLGYDPAHYWDDEHADQIYLRLSLEKCRPWQAFLLQHVFAPIRKTRRH